MRLILNRWILISLGVALALLLPASLPKSAVDAQGSVRPNVLFVLVDDAHPAMLKRPGFINIQREIVQKGTTYPNTVSNYPLCCPGRATLLTGQYAHNHGVTKNNGSPFFGEGERKALPVWLEGAGYRTGLFGKYMNAYEGERIPAGWERWYAFNDPRGMGWTSVNDQGTTISQDKTQADTNVKNKALKFLENSRRPFFAWVGFGAPHAKYYYPAIDAERFKGARAPRTPAFNEADVSDKPEGFVGSLPRLSREEVRQVDVSYRKALRSMMRVDMFVGQAVDILGERGKLDETYIIFYSDNGNHFGEHRLPHGKQAPYETDVNFPFVVRGPGIAQGAKSSALLANHDFAPTIADLAGASEAVPAFVDGRSFAPLLRNASAPWTREWVLIEKSLEAPAKAPAWNAVHSQHITYVEYNSSERELYDLAADPYQLNNTYSEADPILKVTLATRLEALMSCAGQACKEAEDGPVP